MDNRLLVWIEFKFKKNCFEGISIPQLILGTPIPKNQNIIICYSFYKEANNGKNFVFGHLVSQQKRGKKKAWFLQKDYLTQK